MNNKVLIVIGIPNFNYFNEKSAVSCFLLEIYDSFKEQGHEVDFLNSPDDSLIIESVEVKNSCKSILKSLVKKWPWFYISLVYKDYFTRQDSIIGKHLKHKNYTHIVEFHTLGSTVGLQIATMCDATLSVVFDSPVDEQFYEMHHTRSIFWGRIKRTEQLTLEAATGIMVYSPECKFFIRKKYNLKSTINTLPCVISKNSLDRQSSKEFTIGFIGSFLSWHKVDVLVKSFIDFIQEVDSNAKLFLIGYGVEWERIRKMVEKFNLQDNVVMPGFVDEEELLKIKSNLSIAVMPGSNWYGSPLKLFEYAQCGIPFVAPRTKTVASIFTENLHCLYIDPKNEIESLTQHLKYLYQNKKECLEMGQRAKGYYDLQFSKPIYRKKLYNALK